MDKVVKIVSLKDQKSDYEFWQTKTYQERLDAIELLRSHYINFNKDVQSRLVRFCQIVNKKQR